MTLESVSRRVQQQIARDGYKSLWRAPIRAALPMENRLQLRRLQMRLRRRPDPFAIVRVDPEAVVFQQLDAEPLASSTMTTRAKVELAVNDVRLGRFHKYRDAGAVVDGDWDRLDARFDQSVYYRSMYAHFVDDVDWEETVMIRQIRSLIDRDGSAWHGCESRTDVEERCEQVDELYETIRDEGYKSQRDIAEDCSLRERLDEVTVNVGRNGDLLYNSSGAHRLAIAKILGVDEIPVRILVRHARWFETAVSHTPVGSSGREDREAGSRRAKLLSDR